MSDISNPFMRLGRHGDHAGPTLFAPVKDRGLIVTALDRDQASLVWRLIVERERPPSQALAVDGPARDMLCRIGALIPAHALPQEVHYEAPADLAAIEQALARRPVAVESTALRENGHVKLSDLLPAGPLAVANRHITRAAREGWMKYEEEIGNRFVDHNDIVGRTYHPVLVPLIARIAGRPLMASYSYVASYLAGSELKPHTDRDQCDYTLSLHLGQEVDVAPDDWPFEVQATFDDPSWRSYRLQPGDAVLFRGIRLSHRRPARRGNGLYNQILWHFVATDFAGSLD